MPVTTADLQLGLVAAERALVRLKRHHSAGPPDAGLDPALAEHAVQACVRAMHLVNMLDLSQDPRARTVQWHLCHLVHGVLPSEGPLGQGNGPLGLADKAQWLLSPSQDLWLPRVLTRGTAAQAAQAALAGALTHKSSVPAVAQARYLLVSAVSRHGAWVAGPLCWTTDHLLVFPVAKCGDRLPLVATTLVAYWQPQALVNYLVWPQCSPWRDNDGDAPCQQSQTASTLALAFLFDAQLGDASLPEEHVALLSSALYYADKWCLGFGRPAEQVLVTAPRSAAFCVPLGNALATGVFKDRHNRWSKTRRAWAEWAAAAPLF
jgi:hypothetical protein